MTGQCHHVKVAVVGAGLAGLSAAWTLRKAGLVGITVLEAMDRVGGRTLLHYLPNGEYVEQGGTWAGPTQKRILALANEFGIATKTGKPTGHTFYGYRGQWGQVDTRAIEAPSPAQADFTQALATFEALTKTVVTATPWTTPNASLLDATTIGAWIQENTTTDEGRALFEGCVRKMQGGNPDEVSLLWLLHFVASATFTDLLDTAEDFRFVGGSQGISLAIAKELGDVVRTKCQVQKIVTEPRGQVRIEGHGFAPVTADRVIVTAMPAVLGAITFDPPLPIAHRAMIGNWTPMSWVKFNAVYDTPFWRGKSLGSQFLCLDRRVEAFDISPEDESFGEIVGFLLPDCAARADADASGFAKSFLREVYGRGADLPHHFAMKDWNKETCVGGCVSSLKPGVLTQCGAALTAPVGPIHFAGTERSATWVNYMEGAVHSGQQTAERLLARLNAMPEKAGAAQ